MMKVSTSGLYATFGQMNWPNPGEAMRLICTGEAKATDAYKLSVLRAYIELVRLPRREREAIVKQLREAVAIEAKGGAT